MFTFNKKPYYTLTTKEFQRIVEEVKTGDNNCLKVIFEKYSDYCIRNILIKTSCSKQDAEDIFVEAVLNFREKILENKISYLTSLKNYMFNTCYNMWLVRHKQITNQQKKIEDVKIFYYEELAKYEKQPENNHEDLLRITREALNNIKENCQKIINYFYIEKLSMAEIAEKMGFESANVAKTTKSRCFKTLLKNIKMIQEQSTRV